MGKFVESRMKGATLRKKIALWKLFFSFGHLKSSDPAGFCVLRLQCKFNQSPQIQGDVAIFTNHCNFPAIFTNRWCCLDLASGFTFKQSNMRKSSTSYLLTEISTDREKQFTGVVLKPVFQHFCRPCYFLFTMLVMLFIVLFVKSLYFSITNIIIYIFLYFTYKRKTSLSPTI